MEETIRLTTAQAIVRFLTQQYVSRDGNEQRFFAGMFGIFGHGNVTGLGQALEEVGQDLRYYQPRNEQAMVHTAAAYARARNRLQTFACTSSIGPGATNMVTGAAGATINRLPVLLLPGDIFASRRPHPVLQQLEYPGSQDVSVNDCFRPISKYWDRINRPEQILSSLPEAMRVLTDQAETGAVTLCLPEDVQAEAYEFPAKFLGRRVHRIARPVAAASEIDEAVALIRRARHPLIVAGGGVIYAEASAVLDELAGTCGIPVAETQAGKGSLPWNHPWVVGPVGANGGIAANRLAAEADLVIAIGTRMTDFTTASRSAFQHADVRFIGINVTSLDAGKLGALPLVGDARATVEALTGALRAAGYHTDEEYRQTVAALKCQWEEAVDGQRAVTGPGMLNQAQVIGAVNEFSRPRDVVVCAAGSLPGDLLKLWRAENPKGYHLEYGYSCMGYEIAGGLGVKMADPSREVYVMVGDGSYLMLSNEIVTSLQEGYKLTVVLLDNHGFQCIRGLQESAGTPAFGNELRYRDRQSDRLVGPYMPIDFVKNAESLGATAIRAETAEELTRALVQAREEESTVLIYVPVDADARVPSYEGWWDVPVAEVSGEESVRAAAEAYRAAREKQRLYY
jgi:3D-(3,5/4)-trihydroxycyclohexane-1,2-dione acylhydrolase (decyclizing)